MNQVSRTPGYAYLSSLPPSTCLSLPFFSLYMFIPLPQPGKAFPGSSFPESCEMEGAFLPRRAFPEILMMSLPFPSLKF